MHYLSRYHLRLLSLIVISLLFISACSNQGLPESKDFENQASFTFTIDPNDNSVTLEKNDNWLENLRSPATCNTARTLLPNKDLIITEASLETKNNKQYLSFSLKNVTNTNYQNLNVLSPNQKVQTINTLASGETSSSLSFPIAKGSTVFKLAANAIDLCTSENKNADE